MIAVTGASGFIGQAICARLGAAKYSVRALIRNPSQASLPALSGVEAIPGGLSDEASLLRLVDGADAVVHCAGRVRGATKACFDPVNVEGTRNLLRAIYATASRPRLLALSSLAAREPQLSHYATSKRDAERVIEQQGQDIAWTILRPPAVYGPGDRELLPVFKLMARGIALTAGSTHARFSMLFIDDLSAAVEAWLKNNSQVPGIFALDDGCQGGYDWHEVSDVVGRLCERRVRLVQAPAWLLDVPAWINSRFGVLLGTSPMLTPEKLRELRHSDWVCDGREFQRACNWLPEIRLQEGLQSTPGWPGYRGPGATAN
jgi:nucleoside-diphosphate-sugar epimerase